MTCSIWFFFVRGQFWRVKDWSCLAITECNGWGYVFYVFVRFLGVSALGGDGGGVGSVVFKWAYVL